MNYRDLLKRYMNFVDSQEGITFAERLGDDGRSIYSKRPHAPTFTPEEVAELRAIDLGFGLDQHQKVMTAASARAEA